MSNFEVGDLIAAPGEGVAARKVHAIFSDRNGVKRFTFENIHTGAVFTHQYNTTDYRKFVPEPEKFEVGRRYRKNGGAWGWQYHCVFAAEKSAVLAAFYVDGDGKTLDDIDDLVESSYSEDDAPVVGVRQSDRSNWRLV